MKKALIISAFAGCGKTWLVENQERFKYSMRDSDSSTYKKNRRLGKKIRRKYFTAGQFRQL